MLYVLSLSITQRRVAAVLLQDGRLAAAVRAPCSGPLGDRSGPKAIREVAAMVVSRALERARIPMAQLAHVALAGDPASEIWRTSAAALRRHGDHAALEVLLGTTSVGGLVQRVVGAITGREAGCTPRVHVIERHRAQLAQAFLASPFEEAAVAVIGGAGDTITTATGRATGGEVMPLARLFAPLSLGAPFRLVTRHLGLDREGGEASTMRLARDGGDALIQRMRSLVALGDDGRLTFAPLLCEALGVESESSPETPAVVPNDPVVMALGPGREPGTPLTQHHRELASAAQRLFEEMLFHMLGDLWLRAPTTAVCLAGGGARNADAMRRGPQETPFAEVYVAPAPERDGSALGAALYVTHVLEGLPRMDWSGALEWEELAAGHETGSSRGPERRQEDEQQDCRAAVGSGYESPRSPEEANH